MVRGSGRGHEPCCRREGARGLSFGLLLSAAALRCTMQYTNNCTVQCILRQTPHKTSCLLPHLSCPLSLPRRPFASQPAENKAGVPSPPSAANGGTASPVMTAFAVRVAAEVAARAVAAAKRSTAQAVELAAVVGAVQQVPQLVDGFEVLCKWFAALVQRPRLAWGKAAKQVRSFCDAVDYVGQSGPRWHCGCTALQTAFEAHRALIGL